MNYHCCILVACLAFFSNCLFCFSKEGSWFDGMEFEDYKPANDHHQIAKKIQPGQFLQIPCGLILDGSDQSQASSVNPLQTRLDTSLSTTSISWNAVRTNKDLLSRTVKREDRYIIPSGSVWLRMGSLTATVPSPEMDVVELQDSFDLSLGMDFLSTYQGIINMRDGELHIIVEKEDVMIPLIRPRSSLPFDDL
jgi:hypothetical protein